MSLLRHSLTICFLASDCFGQAGENFACPKTENWLQLHRRVLEAHEHLRNRNFALAKFEIKNDAMRIFDDLRVAFTCSIGVTALFRTVALSLMQEAELTVAAPDDVRRLHKLALRLMHIAMNWLTHAFVIEGRNSARWVDDSSWPITLQAINEEETFLKAKLETMGGSGHYPVWESVPVTLRDPKLRLGIVSVCDYPIGNPLPVLSRSNREIYARRHGYYLFEVNKRFDDARPHAWAKITLMRQHIMDDRLDWLLWFDCDTFFMNLTITLDHVLYKYGSAVAEDGRRHLHPDFRMLIQEDHAMLNTGVFFMKTGDWSRELLEEVYGQDDSVWIHHPFWEQASMHHAFLGGLASRIFEGSQPRNPTKPDMDLIYPDGVVVAPQYEFNSYHPISSRLTMHDNWEPGKFVIAFSGCKSGSSQAVVNMLYRAYYELMCRINEVGNECVPMDEV